MGGRDLFRVVALELQVIDGEGSEVQRKEGTCYDLSVFPAD
jgi:hypothetical protein